MGAGVLVLVVAGVVAWAQLRPDPHTRVTGGLVHEVTCSGTSVSHAVMVANEPPVSIVQLSPSMRCAVDIVIRNAGPHDSRLNTVTFPSLGPDAPAGAEMTGPGELSGADGIDATFAVNKALNVGRRVTLTYWLVFHSTGCDNPGQVERRIRVPEVSLTVDGRTETTSGHAILAWSGTDSTRCGT